jgi:hypothetical protein
MSAISLKITLGAPAVVAQGPAGVGHWGPWQFPHLERLADGGLHVSFHLEADAYKAYGLPKGHAVSYDQGQTWQRIAAEPETGGLSLPNGDRLRPVTLRSRPMSELVLPEPLGAYKGTYGSTYVAYRPGDLSADLQDGWRFQRRLAGSSVWVDEQATVRFPGEVRWAGDGMLTFPWVWRLRLAPDGVLWGLNYGLYAPDDVLADKWHVLLLRSADGGHTWNLYSVIGYQPDPRADPFWEQRDGFSENNLAFLGNGSLMCFLRTTDGNGVGPMYAAYSHDGGATWSRPEVFDDRGVWPAVVDLGCGTTLVSYGRPGLFVRATCDPAGQAWSERVPIVEPGALSKDTCSYSDLVALDERTALIAYSDFGYPGPDGLPHKTVLVRTIAV